MMVDLWREVAERSLARMAEDWESQERAKVHLLDSWSRLPVEPLSFHQAFSNTSLNETLKPKSSNLANSSTELTHFPVRFRCCCLKISSSMCPWSQAFACYPAAEQIFIYTNLTKWGLTSGYKGRTRFKFRWHLVMMSSTIKKLASLRFQSFNTVPSYANGAARLIGKEFESASLLNSLLQHVPIPRNAFLQGQDR